MTFEKLSAKWENDLRSLWKTVFGDEDEYISLFFDNYFNETEAFGAIENEKLIAMLFLLPMKVRAGESSFDAKYIYAVATDPEYRGRGVSTKLLDKTHEYLKREGTDLSILVPASGSLFEFYSKRGFRTDFSIDLIDWNRKQPSDSTADLVRESSLASLKHMRDEYFSKCSLYCEYDEKGLSYREKETLFLGGKVLTFTDNKPLGYAVCIPQKDHVLIKESTFGNDERAFASIADYFKRDKLKIRTSGSKIPFAMSYWYTKQPEAYFEKTPYISLVLD